jgi:hypothetical protein
MDNDAIISKLRIEAEDIRIKLMNMQPVACPHTMCPECLKREIEQNKEIELLNQQIIDKENFILEIQGA